jgi:hypothetical protein
VNLSVAEAPSALFSELQDHEYGGDAWTDDTSARSLRRWPVGCRDADAIGIALPT